MNRSPSLENRTSGILLHPTSLPGGHGIGDLGPEAHSFIEFLHRTRQTWWQMFPLGHPGFGNSPYAALSSHAGNPLLISLDYLNDDGLLTVDDIRHESDRRKTHVDFAHVWEFKRPRLHLAYERFMASHSGRHDFDAFCTANDSWLRDYSLFCAIKDTMKGVAWQHWPEDLRKRKPATLRSATARVRGEVDFYRFLQWQFHRQWTRLRQHAREKGVGLMGDMPIFVAQDSCDVWAYPNQFWVDAHGNPTYVAGTPPDYFSASGQRWGNPLYRWDVMKRKGYSWWLERFRSMFGYFDAVRIDHFIGFHRCWRIPGDDTTARNGHWTPGPRSHFFKTMIRKLGRIQLVAEDLGLVTPEVKTLRDEFDFPGMKVLQFAFGSESEANNYLPHSYPRNCVVYTGTHDNDTTVGWFHDMGGKNSTRSREDIRREKEFTLRYAGSDGKEIHWDLIRLAFMSVANTAIIPAQDILGLGSEARTNTPGTIEGNWEWRFEKGDFNEKIADRLYQLTETYARRSKQN